MRTLASLLLLFWVAVPAGGEERFFDWTSLQFPREEYQARRARVAQQLKLTGGGVFLAPSRPGRSGGETFRQLDDFFYLTGLELPDSVLALDGENGRATVYAPDRDARFESPSRPNDFPGRPLAADPVLARVAGIDEVKPLSALGPALHALVAAGRVLRTMKLPEDEGALVAPFDPDADLARSLRRLLPGARLSSARTEMARVRMVKSPAEVEVLRRATGITVKALAAASLLVADGIDERKLEAEFEAGCKREGAQRVAFDSIVKSGPNALYPWRILAAHYDRRNRILRSGEIVVWDVGCEADHYVSDLGRTLPVGGRFSPEQRRVLAMEVAVADAMIAALRPGVTLAAVQAAGLLRIPAEERAFMQAPVYFGHHIGLSAGDPSLDDAPLEPGMVLTVEPWYYNRSRGLAAFTEDVLLLTATGAENLSAALPRTPEALEALVKSGRSQRK